MKLSSSTKKEKETTQKIYWREIDQKKTVINIIVIFNFEQNPGGEDDYKLCSNTSLVFLIDIGISMERINKMLYELPRPLGYDRSRKSSLEFIIAAK